MTGADHEGLRPQYHFRKLGEDVLIWDVRALARLAASLPVEPLPLSAIREIDEPYWFGATSDEATCRRIMDHAAQVTAADLSYPIIICPEGRIMDGMHRVMKALAEGHATIPARRLTRMPEPDYRNKRPDELPY